MESHGSLKREQKRAHLKQAMVPWQEGMETGNMCSKQFSPQNFHLAFAFFLTIDPQTLLAQLFVEQIFTFKILLVYL